jgi:hypothetical protein
MTKKTGFILLLLLPLLSLSGQQNRSLQEIFLEAEYFFLNEDYSDALPLYHQLYEKLPDNSNLAYRIGVCYLNISGKKDLSIGFLETATRNVSAKHKEGTINQVSAPYDVWYDLGRAYQVNYVFDKAKTAFEKFTGTLLEDDTENHGLLKQLIKSCENAKDIISHPVSLAEENIGNIFNDDKPNFNPVMSADGKTLAYMVSLKFYDAIMFSRQVNGKWSMPVNITPELQAEGGVYISSLSADGKVLFLSLDDNYNSDIYASTFDGTKWSGLAKLNKNINTKYWESQASISEDGNQLYFASDRPGGSGGLDLYVSKKFDGDWGQAVNLGPSVNTPYNEDRPVLVNKGKTLFFSSQGHRNLGGYDLFKAELKGNNTWSTPENLGYPLNTPDDNIFFTPLSDGKSGYISIYKDKGGFGREDIYRIYFK